MHACLDIEYIPVSKCLRTSYASGQLLALQVPRSECVSADLGYMIDII